MNQVQENKIDLLAHNWRHSQQQQ